MLEGNPEFVSIFHDKRVESVCVDGCSDKPPSHEEEQFYWTERHLIKGNESIVVTTRHSGGSYLNRVELLNGCLAVAHSNLFIPSTLGGPCYTEKGLDKEQLAKNLELAMDVYIKKVDGAPCAKQPIRLVKGANGVRAKHVEERRPKLMTFLKGKKKEKEALKRLEPALYSYFQDVWGVRNRHMVKDLPQPYVFMLLPCKAKHCPHPRCQDNGNSDDGNT